MILLALAAGLFLPAEEGRPAVDCDSAINQQDLNRCAYAAWKQADAALNVQWKLTLERMRKRDEDIDREFDSQPSNSLTLLESQRAWIKYRDGNCLLESFMARGGTMAPMLESFCLAHMTEERTKELKELAADLEVAQ